MPIDTPFNRRVTDQYNKLLRDKVEHEEATLQTVMPSPAGMYVNGYEPVMVGSGVGIYKKGKSCPMGHDVCTCGSGSAHGSAHGAGSAHGQYDRVVGGANLGLIPAVRVELALGAGMRGDATSKHGCLDRHEEFCHGGRRHGNKGQAYNRLLAEENANKNKALRQLGNGEGGKGSKGFKPRKTKPAKQPKPAKPAKQPKPAKAPRQSTTVNKTYVRNYHNAPAKESSPKKEQSPKKEEPKKEEPKKSIYTLENLEKGFNTAERIGNTIGKVAPMVQGAYNFGKQLFGYAKGKAHGKAHGGFALSKQNIQHLNHKEKERKEREAKKGKGKSHGKTRCEIVRQVMNKLGCSMIEASKHVKANGLY
jgi:hypothetical protein